MTENGFKDVLMDFNPDALSMHKTPKFSPWRPDKICMSVASEKRVKPISTQICGNFATLEFPGENPLQINEDGIVRTPSDHLAVIADFELID